MNSEVAIVTSWRLCRYLVIITWCYVKIVVSEI